MSLNLLGSRRTPLNKLLPAPKQGVDSQPPTKFNPQSRPAPSNLGTTDIAKLPDMQRAPQLNTTNTISESQTSKPSSNPKKRLEFSTSYQSNPFNSNMTINEFSNHATTSRREEPLLTRGHHLSPNPTGKYAQTMISPPNERPSILQRTVSKGKMGDYHSRSKQETPERKTHQSYSKNQTTNILGGLKSSRLQVRQLQERPTVGVHSVSRSPDFKAR